MKNRLPLLLIVLVIGFVLSQTMFFVNQYETALVLELGTVTGKQREPGLNFKIPFVQRAVFLDQRVLSFAISKNTVNSKDKKIFEIDNYVCWRIQDSEKFIMNLRTQELATERLRSIISSKLTSEIGNNNLQEVVGEKRNEIMNNVRQTANIEVAPYGVVIVDVRVKRTDLPNRVAIIARMNTDREKIANLYKAEGKSRSMEIRSNADRVSASTLAEAQKQSIIIRGEAEAEAMRVLNKAITSAPEFYDFVKSLEVYSKAFKENSKVVFSTNDPLLQFLQ